MLPFEKPYLRKKPMEFPACPIVAGRAQIVAKWWYYSFFRYNVPRRRSFVEEAPLLEYGNLSSQVYLHASRSGSLG